MPKLTARIKLFIVLGIFGLFAGLMFLYGYSILESRNQILLDATGKKRFELEVLQREQKNFEQGKKDIAALESKDYPPQELFSKDTKVVKEIRKLEELAAAYNLKLTLNISGTAETAQAAKGVTAKLAVIPYTMQLEGTYSNIERYLQASEHTPFINHNSAISITAMPNNVVQATLNAQFYLKQNK